MKRHQFQINDEFEDESIDYIVANDEHISYKNSFASMSFKVSLDRMKLENSFLQRENSILKDEISYLRGTVSNKMDAHKARLEEIIKLQTQIPKIYYVGTLFGIIGIIFGISKNNLIYTMGGIGVSATAIVGMLELAYGTKIKRTP